MIEQSIMYDPTNNYRLKRGPNGAILALQRQVRVLLLVREGVFEDKGGRKWVDVEEMT